MGFRADVDKLLSFSCEPLSIETKPPLHRNPVVGRPSKQKHHKWVLKCREIRDHPKRQYEPPQSFYFLERPQPASVLQPIIEVFGHLGYTYSSEECEMVFPRPYKMKV